MGLESEIVNWYLRNKRDLPWRKTKNPYEIWISEVILQQTRVNQALSYYYTFLENFPTVSSLAQASEQEVLKIWQGLGYYSRARNLHSSAKQVLNDYNGKFPQNYLDLLKLKGIGNYTAAAIASFAYNEKVAVVDGNVFRVLSRIYAESTPINTGMGKKLFFDLASQLLTNQEPYIFNQAIMEFGAIQCTVKNPDCPNCVIKGYCKAFNQKKVEDYPVKLKTFKKKNRFFNYIIIDNGGFTYLKKRGPKDIWQGLFEFPLIESDFKLDFENILKTKEWSHYIADANFNIVAVSNNIIHQLTHQQLDIKFITIKTDNQSQNFKHLQNGFLEVPIDELSKYPVAKPIENFIKENYTI